jgi:hypothetical protein
MTISVVSIKSAKTLSVERLSSLMQQTNSLQEWMMDNEFCFGSAWY